MNFRREIDNFVLYFCTLTDPVSRMMHRDLVSSLKVIQENANPHQSDACQNKQWSKRSVGLTQAVIA